MIQFLKKLRYRKRSHLRCDRTGMVLLFSAERKIGVGELVDESEGGAQVRTRCPRLRELHYILNPEGAQVAKVRLAWQSDDRIGLEYLSVVNVRGFIDDPAILHIKDAWRDMAFDHQRIASKGAFSR